jgi:hypothetical protein
MKSIVRSALVITEFCLLSLTGSSIMAQTFMGRQIEVDKIYSVREVSSGMVEIELALTDGSKTVVRMNIFTAQLLAAQLNRFNL